MKIEILPAVRAEVHGGIARDPGHGALEIAPQNGDANIINTGLKALIR